MVAQGEIGNVTSQVEILDAAVTEKMVKTKHQTKNQRATYLPLTRDHVLACTRGRIASETETDRLVPIRRCYSSEESCRKFSNVHLTFVPKKKARPEAAF